MNSRFDYSIINAIENAIRNMKAAPLILGGVNGSGGGAGGPGGGFIGYLPQKRVCYDTSEIAYSGIVGSGSLLDNLNHIRYRLDGLETGSGGGASAFINLTDVPATYSGSIGKAVIVNPAGDGLIFSNIATGSGGSPGYQTLTDGATISWDLAFGSAEVTISGNRTLESPTNMNPGEHYFLSVIQDGVTGGRILTYDTAYKFPSNVKPILSTYPGTLDLLTFECDGNFMMNTGLIKNLTNTEVALSYLTNLLLWLKADSEAYSDSGTTLCNDADLVHTWKDQSGNSNDAVQTTADNRPEYKTNIRNAKPVVRFNGTDMHLLVTAMDAGDDCSFFMVIIPSSTTPVGLFDTTAGTTPPIRNYPGGVWESYDGAPSVTMELPSTDAVLLEFVHNADSNMKKTLFYYKNGSYISDAATGNDAIPTAWGDPRIGSINDGSAGWYGGDLAELLVYNETISDVNRETVEIYLKGKYGIS
jgi:hypothetical protein